MPRLHTRDDVMANVAKICAAVKGTKAGLPGMVRERLPPLRLLRRRLTLHSLTGPHRVPRVQHAGHHVRQGRDVRDSDDGAGPRDGGVRGGLQGGRGVGRLLPHRRAPRGAPGQEPVQHPRAHQRGRRGRPEVPQNPALEPHRGLVPRLEDPRHRGPQGPQDLADHLRRRQLPRDLARLRDEGRRAGGALPGLHVPSQGAAGDGCQDGERSRRETPAAWADAPGHRWRG